MASVTPHQEFFQNYLYSIPSKLGNLAPEQEYMEKMRATTEARKQRYRQQAALDNEMRLEAEAIRDMNTEQEYAPQGVTRPPAQRYGSENMYNHVSESPTVVPVSPNNASSVPEQSATPKILGSKREPAIQWSNQPKEPKAPVRSSPSQFGSPFGEYQTTMPDRLGQSRAWHQSMKDQALPTRDMRDSVYTSRVTGAEVPNYPAMDKMSARRAELAQNQAKHVNNIGQFNKQSALGSNQSSDNQLPNNGNINNPKMLNNPKANSNGFF